MTRHGTDLEQRHSTGAPGTSNPGGISRRSDGDLLQIARWRSYRNMTDRDLRDILEYLGAVPRLADPPRLDSVHNDYS